MCGRDCLGSPVKHSTVVVVFLSSNRFPICVNDYVMNTIDSNKFQGI